MSDGLGVLAGGALLYFGAEWFVRGASSLALALRVPQLIVGLTVVAYGTSAPELIVESTAAASGHGGVAFGDALGSNIANIGLILGIAALIRPAVVSGSLARREVPVLLAGVAAVPLLMLDGVVSRLESVLLLAVAFAYTLLMVRAARLASAVADATLETMVTGDAADAAGAPAPRGVLASLATDVFLCLGIAAQFGPVGMPLRQASFEIAALIGMTVLAAWFIRSERVITRREGVVMLGLYAAFMAVTIARG